MAEATTVDVEALKRWIRLLTRCIQSFERQEIVSKQITCFSMLAESQEHEFLQNLLRETSSISTSTTQAVVSLSSAEAEFYAAVKAAAAGIGCVSVMRDLGVVLQQQGVEVKAKGLGDGIDSPRRRWTHQTHRNPDAMVAARRDQCRHQHDASWWK